MRLWHRGWLSASHFLHLVKVVFFNHDLQRFCKALTNNVVQPNWVSDHKMFMWDQTSGLAHTSHTFFSDSNMCGGRWRLIPNWEYPVLAPEIHSIWTKTVTGMHEINTVTQDVVNQCAEIITIIIINIPYFFIWHDEHWPSLSDTIIAPVSSEKDIDRMSVSTDLFGQDNPPSSQNEKKKHEHNVRLNTWIKRRVRGGWVFKIEERRKKRISRKLRREGKERVRVVLYGEEEG